ncbi:MAG: hypothetical protein J6B71_00660 [Clostridia bacterium]|nr:hypothetical protein [Clostridia bacterium]
MKDNQQTSEQDTTDLADQVLPASKAEYVGKEFKIIYRDAYSYEWEYVEEDAGATINDAIFERNSAVEDRYDIWLAYHPVANASFENDFLSPIKTSVLSGDNTFQLAAGYEYRLAYNSTLGDFLDWHQISNVDLEADWWDGNFAKAAAYRDRAYVMTGSLSLSHLYSSACVFFNQDFVNARLDGGSAEIFDLVESGNWTLEAFETYITQFTADDDGIDGMTKDDSYGYATNTYTAVDAFLFCSDISVSGRTEDGTVKLYGAGEKLGNLATILHRIINTSGKTYKQDGEDAEIDQSIGMMLRGKTAFTTANLKNASELRTTEINYGILPYPKYDASQKKYYSITMDYSSAFAIPRTAGEDIDFVGAITEAMAFYSHEYVRDALYSTVLKYRDAKDADSSKCIDIILENPRYDFAYIYAFAWGDQQGPSAILRNCINANTDAVSVLFQSLKTSYNTKLGYLLENFQQ